jgi:hypothetical protein
MKREKLFITLCLFFLPLLSAGVFAQSFNANNSNKDLRRSYIELSAGAGMSLFRDLATSPLFYDGASFSISGGYIGTKKNREIYAGTSYNYGLLTGKFNNTSKSASFYSLDLNHHIMYTLNRYSSSRWSIKSGWSIISTTNIRENSALMNNSLGVENISNIMAAARLTHALSKKSSISISLNVGILNMNFRPGYAYNYIPQITGLEISNFGDYKLSVNGFRVQSRIDYTRFFMNRNSARITYFFDAYSAPGRYEPLHFLRHSLILSLLFNYR